MGILDKLTYTDTSRKEQSTHPALILRRKMVAILTEQFEAAQCELNGQLYIKKTEKWKRNKDGIKELILVQSAVRKFWFQNAENKIILELRFGNKAMPINGRNSVVVGDANNLPKVIKLIIDAVSNGELDQTLLLAAENRKRVRRGKPALSSSEATSKPNTKIK